MKLLYILKNNILSYQISHLGSKLQTRKSKLFPRKRKLHGFYPLLFFPRFSRVILTMIPTGKMSSTLPSMPGTSESSPGPGTEGSRCDQNSWAAQRRNEATPLPMPLFSLFLKVSPWNELCKICRKVYMKKCSNYGRRQTVFLRMSKPAFSLT